MKPIELVSAQKTVLTTLSTRAMIRLGKTYGDLMVDIRARNDKLRERARRIVEAATDADSETAAKSLAAAGGSAKAAIVMLVGNVTVEAAQQRLRRHGGSVRAAVNNT